MEIGKDDLIQAWRAPGTEGPGLPSWNRQLDSIHSTNINTITNFGFDICDQHTYHLQYLQQTGKQTLWEAGWGRRLISRKRYWKTNHFYFDKFLTNLTFDMKYYFVGNFFIMWWRFVEVTIRVADESEKIDKKTGGEGGEGTSLRVTTTTTTTTTTKELKPTELKIHFKVVQPLNTRLCGPRPARVSFINWLLSSLDDTFIHSSVRRRNYFNSFLVSIFNLFSFNFLQDILVFQVHPIFLPKWSFFL